MSGYAVPLIGDRYFWDLGSSEKQPCLFFFVFSFGFLWFLLLILYDPVISGFHAFFFVLFSSFRVCSGMLVSPRWEIGNSLHATVAFAGFRKWLSHAALKLEKGYSLLYTGIYF